MSRQPISVLCVDDNADISDMLAAVIRAESDMTCAGTLNSADELVDSIARLKPDIVLLDLTMPGRSPLEAMKEAHERHADTRTIIVSGYDDQKTIDDAIDHGAWGYASKHGDIALLLNTIRRVSRGESVLTP